MKYHVFYIERCTSKIKSFHRKSTALKFIGQVELNYLDSKDDNWVEGLVYGDLFGFQVELSNAEV